MATKAAKEPPLPADLNAQLDALSARRWDDGDADDTDAAARLAQLRLDWKTLGNACYGQGCFLAAVRCYTRLLELPGGDTAQVRSNRSAAYLQSPMLAGASLALKDAEAAVRMEPQWFKGHVRVGDAQRKRGHVAEAEAAYRQALALQPVCAAAQAGLRAVHADGGELSGAAATFPRARPATCAPAGAASPRCGAGARMSEPSAASASAAAAPRTPQEEQARHLTPEELVQSWKADISTREDRTGCRPMRGSLSEADRRQGATVKEALLARFRTKVETNEGFGETLRERREARMRCGDGVNYREADALRHTYSHATNGIGLGISSDAYKAHIGRVDHRTW